MLVARQTRLGQARLIRKLILAPVCNAWPCKNPHQRWQVPTRACLSQTGAGGTCHLWCGFLDGQATQDLPSFVLVCKVFLTPFRCWCPHVKPPERSSYVAPVATSVLKASSLASLLTRSHHLLVPAYSLRLHGEAHGGEGCLRDRGFGPVEGGQLLGAAATAGAAAFGGGGHQACLGDLIPSPAAYEEGGRGQPLSISIVFLQ